MNNLKSKLIIRNYTNLTDAKVLSYIYRVVLGGKISGSKGKEQYCYLTCYDDIVVTCDRRNDTYTFYVYKEENK